MSLIFLRGTGFLTEEEATLFAQRMMKRGYSFTFEKKLDATAKFQFIYSTTYRMTEIVKGLDPWAVPVPPTPV